MDVGVGGGWFGVNGHSPSSRSVGLACRPVNSFIQVCMLHGSCVGAGHNS